MPKCTCVGIGERQRLPPTISRKALSASTEGVQRNHVPLLPPIQVPGLVNVDFADVRTIMLGAGTSLMGQGRAMGKDRAREAAIAATSSPLLEVWPGLLGRPLQGSAGMRAVAWRVSAHICLQSKG